MYKFALRLIPTSKWILSRHKSRSHSLIFFLYILYFPLFILIFFNRRIIATCFYINSKQISQQKLYPYTKRYSFLTISAKRFILLTKSLSHDFNNLFVTMHSKFFRYVESITLFNFYNRIIQIYLCYINTFILQNKLSK